MDMSPRNNFLIFILQWPAFDGRKEPQYGENLNFRTSKGKKMVQKIDRIVREIGDKLKCSAEEGNRLLVRVIERFEKMRVREIGIVLYMVRKEKQKYL